MKYYLLSALVLFLAGCSTKEDVSNSSPAKVSVAQKVETCLACHGADGKSGKPGVPALGSRPYEELVEVMRNIRETYSYSPQPLLGHSLTDGDIHDIATYFSNIK